MFQKLQHVKDLKERNSIYRGLRQQEKRREIAWDCILLIMNGKIKGSDGCYWSIRLVNIAELMTFKDLQESLQNLPTGCMVCARGGMLLGQIRLGSEISPPLLPYTHYFGANDAIDGFSLIDLNYIESEYENNLYRHPYLNNTTEKLHNICLNILHNGNFNTNDRTDYLSLFR